MLTIVFLLVWVCILGHIARPRRELPDSSYNLNNVLLMLPLILLLGLRTGYNDTHAYVSGFQDALPLSELLHQPEDLELLGNPLFYLYTSAMRTLTDNVHIYFMVSSVFVVALMISFFCRIADNDTYALTMYAYLAMGTYFFALAAMKQTIAMAILCHSVLALRDKKRIRFWVLVFIAGLFHTYAWSFAILPLLTGRPWKIQTYAVVAATVFVMATFEETISAFLEYADALGKGASEEMVFSGEGMNMFRVVVYGIVPACSLIFRHILEPKMERKHHIMMHMSIVSFMFMLLASIDGANMFGRMARYFEVGTVYMFPWTIRNLFNRRSQIIAVGLFLAAFFVFAMYQYQSFDDAYRGITILEFLQSLLTE